MQSILWWICFLAVSLPVARYVGVSVPGLSPLGGRLVEYGRDVAVSGLVLLGSVGAGGAIVGGLGLRRAGSLDLIFAIGVGLGLVALAVFFVGMAGLFYPQVLLAIALAAGSVALLSPHPKALVAAFLADLRQWGRLVAHDAVAGLSTIFALGGVADMTITHALVPPVDWDSLAYHLALSQIYLTSHRITYLPFVIHGNWPLNLEMLYTLVLAVGSERSPDLLTVLFLLVGLVSLILSGFRLGSCRTGALAAAIYSDMPVVLHYAGTAEVDIPVAVFGFLALLAWYAGWKWRDVRYFVVSGLLAGFAAGSKLTGAETGLCLGLFLAIALVVTQTFRTHWSWLVAFAGPALLVVAPWYAKSWITTGNPIWPFLPQVFPSLNWDQYGDFLQMTWLKSPGTGTSFGSLLLVPWNLSVTDAFGASVGPLVFALVPFALIFRKWRGFAFYLTFFGTTVTIIWFFLTQQSRFLSPALLAFAFVAGIGLTQLWDAAPRPGRAVAAIALVVWLILQFPLVTDRSSVEESLPYISGRIDRSTFLRHHVDMFPVIEYANTSLPPDANVLLLLYEDRGFYLERPYFWGNPVAQRIVRYEQISSAAELSHEFSTLGLTYAIINPRADWPAAPGGDHVHELIDAYVAQYLQPVYSASGITLYRILPEPQ